jgi:hypothetical protein
MWRFRPLTVCVQFDTLSACALDDAAIKPSTKRWIEAARVLAVDYTAVVPCTECAEEKLLVINVLALVVPEVLEC